MQSQRQETSMLVSGSAGLRLLARDICERKTISVSTKYIPGDALLKCRFAARCGHVVRVAGIITQ